MAATLNGTLSGSWVKASSHSESSSSSSICSDSPPPAAVVDGSCAWERRHQQDAGGFHPQEQRQAPHRVWYKQWGEETLLTSAVCDTRTSVQANILEYPTQTLEICSLCSYLIGGKNALKCGHWPGEKGCIQKCTIFEQLRPNKINTIYRKCKICILTTPQSRERTRGNPNWLKWMWSGDRFLNDVDAPAAAAAAVLLTLSRPVMLCAAHWTRGTVPKTWSPRWLIGNTFFSYWALRGE